MTTYWRKQIQGNLHIIDDGVAESRTLLAVPELEELQEAVRGYIEQIPYFEIYEGQPCIAFCNEEAKLHGFPYNHPANSAWRIAFKAATGKTPEPDYLVGPIAIVTGDEEFLEAL